MFKKIRMISILAVVLCVALWLGSAMTEEQNTFVTVTNGTLNQDGAYTGSYYYRVDLSSVPDDIQIGMGFGPIDGNKPYDQDFRVVPVSELAGTSGNRFLLSFPDTRVESPTDALYLKLDERDNEWTRLVFVYDTSKTNAPKATVTSTAVPALNEDYEIKWSAVSGADIYGVHWKAANGEEYVTSVEGNRTSITLSELANRGRYEDYGDMTRFPGVCEAWVDVYKGGEIGEGAHKTFTIAAQVNDQDERHIYLTSDRVEAEDSNGKTYYAARVHEDVWFTVMADEYVRGRMKDLIFVNGDYSDRLSAWDMNQVGRVDTKWVPENEVSGSKDYTVYAAALIQGEEGEYWVYSDLKTVRVSMTEPLAGTLSFSGADLTTSKPFAAEHPIAQDESLVIRVDYNKKDANDNVPDFYGCKIDEENGDTIVDSQWVTAESEGSTEVRMPMFRTEVGKTYQATVYAVKMGGPTIEAADPITVTTGSRKGNQPIILQMKSTYETDERIRIYGYYDNAKKLNEDNSWIHLRVYKKGSNDSIFDMEGEGFYLWEDHMRINEPGTYVAEAVILQDFGNWQANEVGGTRTTFEFTVSGNKGQLSDPTITLGTTQAETGTQLPITMSGSACGTGDEAVDAERYTFRVYRYENDEEIDYSNVLRESFSNGAGTLHIDTDVLGIGKFEVEVEATARGYLPKKASTTFTVRRKPEVSITSHQATDGVYSIPVHSDFTVRINAEGADHVELDLDRGWDREPIFLEEFEEWWNGAWGENHEDIELTLQYDESCEGQDVANFPMKVKASYWFDGKDDAPIMSDSLTVVSTRNGQVDVSSWEPARYWKIEEDGDVAVSFWKQDDNWIDSSVTGISIERGKNLYIYLGTPEDDDRPDGCVDFSGFLLPDSAGWDMYDMGEPEKNGWLTLNTAKFGNPESNTPITGHLRLYAWKNGWDSNFKDYQITITNTKVTAGANWLFYGVDTDGNVEVQTHEGISFSVYVPGANQIEIIATDKDGDDLLHDSWGRELYAMTNWRLDSGAELTFKAVAEFVGQNGTTTTETYTYPGTIKITSVGMLPAPTVTLTSATNYIQKGQNVGFTVTENSAVFKLDENEQITDEHKDEYKGIWYNAYLFDEEWKMLDAEENLDLSKSYSFPTAELQEGKFYHITVDIQQIGWTGAANEAVFAVVSNKEGLQTKTITLKVDGKTYANGSTIDVPSSKQTRVGVVAQGATAVRVLQGNRSEYWFGNDSYYRDWSFGNDTILAAVATYDPLPENFDGDGWDWNNWNWDSLNWTGVSNTVALHITNIDDMPKPKWHLEQKTGDGWVTVEKADLSIPQGTELRVVYHTSGNDAIQFPENFGNTNYWGFVNIGRQEQDRWGSWWNWADDNWNWDGENHQIEIPTVVYEPGHYKLQIGLDAEGWNGQADEIEFDITKNNALAPASLILSRESMLTGDNLNIIAYAPGANYLEVAITKAGEENWNEKRDCGGERGNWGWGCGSSGTYTFTLSAYNENGKYAEDSKTLTVNRKNDQAILARPEFVNVPSIIPLGTGINGSFQVVNGAENYRIELKYMPDGGDDEEIFSEDRDPDDENATALVFSGEKLNKAGRYKLSVSVDAHGYDNGYQEQDIVVLPGKQDEVGEHVIKLKVNDQEMEDGSTLEWPSSKRLKVKVEVPQGAETPTAIRLLNGDDWEFVFGNDSGERNWGFGDSTDLIAMATYTPLPQGFDQEGWDWRYWDWNTDVAWTAVSNIVHLNIINDGDMPEPEFDLKIKQANGWTPVNTGNLCVPRGTEMQIVYRMSGENAIQFPENFGDTDYWGFVNIEQQEGNEWGTWWNGTYYDWNWDRGSHSITIETIVYEPGHYRMRVGLDAEGWRGNDKEFEFDITENDDLPAASLMLDKEEMVVGDNVGFYAYAPGAEHLRIDMTWEQDGELIENWQWSCETDDEYGDWNWGCGEHGVYTIKLGVFYPKGSGKQDTEITKTLTVTATARLAEIKIKNIEVVNWTGDNINGSFDIIEKEGVQYATPDSYRVTLNYWPDFGEGEEIYDEERHEDDTGLTTLAFSSNLINRPGMYYLQVSAEKYGYDHGYDDLVFIVLPKSPEQTTLTLKVNGSTSNVTDWKLYQPLEDVDVVTPTGVTAVRIWKRNHFEYFAGNRRYNDCDWSFEAGVWTMVAQATTDTQVTAWLNEHGDLDQFDWNQVNWSLTSNSLTVEVIKSGNLNDPAVKYGGNAWPEGGVTITRGNPLTFTIGTVANCDYLGIKVRKADAGDGEWIVDTDLQYTETATVSIPTDGFEAGNYQLVIDPRRYGYQGYEKYYAFTVVEPEGWENQASFTVGTMDALTREAVTFSIYAPGAERVKLCYRSEDNEWQNQEGEILVGNVQMNWVRDYDVYAYALYPNNNSWTQIGSKTIHVTAPNGTLDMTPESVPASIKASENLDVTMSCEFGESNGYFECWLTDVNNRDYEFRSLGENTVDGITTETFRIDGGTLQPGVYILSGYAFPNKMGWKMGTFERTITVTAAGETAEDLQLQLGKTEAQTGDDVGIMAYAKGATHVKVEVIFPEGVADPEWANQVFEVNGDTVQNSAFMGEVACTVTVKLTATYASGDPRTLTKTITVGAPNGALTPTIRLNRAWTAGSGLDFTVDVGKNDAQYVVKVREKGLVDTFFFDFQRGTRERDYYVQPTNFMPGKTYEIEVIAAGSGYGRGEAKLTLRCRKASPMTMRLPGGLRTIEAEAFEGVIAEKIIVPAGVTTIGSKAFANCSRLMEIELPEGITSISADAFSGCGTIFVYGKKGSDLERYASQCANLEFVEVK